ncbi:MAG: hypothetical protein HF978_16710 [Desulfobacteraceae bacterium]|nr:hypothetical protein [Desulfobacteraceae bacterium]MBC2757185.1 hypothetical protein [Desulfobacteraceae bacterium]
MLNNIDLNKFQLKAYSIELPFALLKLGVDNVRYDVYISSEFRKVTERFIFELIIKTADASEPFIINPEINWFKETSEFQRLCAEVLTDSINKAKSQSEIQIDFLAQTALVKMLTEEIQHQYEEAIQHCKNVIRKQEFSHQVETTLKLREEVASIIQRKNQIVRNVGAELFEYFVEVQNDVNKLRTANFGDNARLPEELFSNPILQMATHSDGFFMIENYVLMGHRLEDPVNYNTLINLLTAFLNRMDKPSEKHEKLTEDTHQKSLKNYTTSYDTRADEWIKHIDNIDKLFNYFHSQAVLKKLKQRNAPPQKIQICKDTLILQKRLLNQIFKLISKEKMISGIVAAYQMRPAFEHYCPPLSPQECLQYLVVPKARKNTIRKLKRFKKYFGKSFPLSPLKRTIRRVRTTSRQDQKKYLVRFLKDFSKYHRDLRNNLLIKETSDSINITTDEKIINLSRSNHCLYEFKLPYEDVFDKKPIINHVVLKADVRGSSAIIEQMKSKKLNPASNFSLNFFEPISKILSLYGAVKIFIEGDAIILSIFEHQDTPGRWYSVSRACGLAINILMIVKKYNKRNRKKGLPRLELGVGIGFSNAPPTFFYDEENQIMISPAITDADQLSRCDKTLRQYLSKEKLPFNVYELQPALNPETSILFNHKTLRYNVKGIQLSHKGFKKLSKEIHLKRLECEIPEIEQAPLTLYTGKFPTTAGNFQRLIIRKATIPEVSLKDLSIIGQTENTYYEVCTNQKLYEHVKKAVK